MVDRVDVGGTTKNGRVGGEKADRTSTKDCDGITRLKSGKVETRPGGGEDVGGGYIRLLEGGVGGFGSLCCGSSTKDCT